MRDEGWGVGDEKEEITQTSVYTLRVPTYLPATQ